MAFALPASAETYSGTCGAQGDNLTWTLDTETGVLTISGTGEMEHYAWSDTPWYSYRKNIKTVDIQNGLTSIGYEAFCDCSSLTSITIPNSVTSIGNYAFSGCSSLTSITIPNGVTSIGNDAFSACSSLTRITIPDSVTSIGDSAFRECSGLTSITIPSSVTSIGYSAFENCSGLTSVTIGIGVTSISGGAFYNCSSLTSITIPNGVTSIGDSAFENCRGLTSITIPNSVTSIGWHAFSDCSRLTSITIPDSVTSIGDYAFYNCSSLTSITIPESVTRIGNVAFKGCSSLKTVYNCSSLDLVKGSTDQGYVAYYADNVYRHKFMTPEDGECVLRKPATCTTRAIYYYGDCVFCGANGKGTVEYGDSLGHTLGAAATCTTAQTCTICEAILSEAFGHSIATSASTPPTCVDSGLTGREQCTVCEVVLVAEEVIAPLGHAFDLISDEGTQCSRCSVFVPREVAGPAVSPFVIVAAGASGVVILVAVIVIMAVSAKRAKQKKALLRAAEFEHWESQSRR